MVWKNILKNQKTFQSLGIGEIDLDSAVDEPPKCIPKLKKILDNMERVETELANKFGEYIQQSKTRPVRNHPKFHSMGYNGKLGKSDFRLAYIRRRDVYVSEEEACEILEVIKNQGQPKERHELSKGVATIMGARVAQTPSYVGEYSHKYEMAIMYDRYSSSAPEPIDFYCVFTFYFTQSTYTNSWLGMVMRIAGDVFNV